MLKKLFSKIRSNFSKSSSLEKPNGMVSLQKDNIKKKLKNDKVREAYFEQQSINLHKDKTNGYILTRKYDVYNFIFNNLFSSHKKLRRDIIDSLRVMAYRHKKKKIYVLDDGAGKGYFLSELKEKWNRLRNDGKVKASLETTAVTLTPKIILSKKSIDEIFKGDVSKFVSNKKYDLIISVFGGFQYTIPVLQKEVLLKYCYSLNKGGFGIFGFDLNNEINTTLIKKALEKRGFRAEFISSKKMVGKSLPSEYLVIERVR